jgi:multidrug resistance efflux pump
MTRAAFRKEYLLYGAAVAALAFSMTSVMKSQPRIERLEPAGAIAMSPFDASIAATGVVEPISRTIDVAPDIEGVVKSIFVEPGDRVTAGAPLFALEDRRQIAAVEEAKAQVARADAEIELKRAEGRAAAAAASAARVAAKRLRASVERYGPIAAEAMSAEDFDKLEADAERAEFDYLAADENAKSAAAAAQAAIGSANLARAERAGAEADLARTILRSPIAGAVLSIDVRLGEAIRPTDRKPASISVGDIGTLVVRVQIDEAQAARFAAGADARAFVRGGEAEAIPLQFLSIEPMLKPRTAFRDAAAEYADARVLEARYAIGGAAPAPLYVGQLLDVYIDASGARSPAPSRRPAAENLGASTVGMLLETSPDDAPEPRLRP